MSQVKSLQTGIKFKDTPIGKIPVDWEASRLGDLCVGKAEYGANAPAIEKDDNLPRYVRITDINDNGRLLNSTRQSIDWKAAGPYILRKGDFLFARSGATVGKTYLYRKEDGECAFAGYLIRFRPDPSELLPDFLFHFTHSSVFYQWVKGMLRAGAQPNINGKEYSDLILPLPPLPEQKNIAEILTTVDDAIEETDRIIEKTKELKKGLMQELLTRGIGHKKFKKAEIGEIPEEWEVSRLDNLISVKHGYAFEGHYFGSEGQILLTPGNFSEHGGLYFTDRNLKRYSGDYPKEFELLPGDLVLVMTDLSPFCKILGNPALIPQGEAILHNQRIGKIVLKSKKIEKGFLFYFFLSEMFKRVIKSTATGTTVRHTAPNRILDIKIALPNLYEQKKIARMLNKVDLEIEDEEIQKQSLETLKKSLMQVLLTGRVRVNLH